MGKGLFKFFGVFSFIAAFQTFAIFFTTQPSTFLLCKLISFLLSKLNGVFSIHWISSHAPLHEAKRNNSIRPFPSKL